jgi:bacterioferritin-associated ferredoxin
MVVCSCRAVTDREIRAAIDAGACTTEALGAACGAGGRCGGCWPTLRRLIDDVDGVSVRTGLAAG